MGLLSEAVHLRNFYPEMMAKSLMGFYHGLGIEWSGMEWSGVERSGGAS